MSTDLASSAAAPYRRVLRRSQHRSRSTAVVIALVALIVVLAWVGTESVLAVFGLAPLLVAPAALLHFIDNPDSIGTAAAGALALLGVVLLAVALSPGRRARHALPDDRMAVVIDDGVLAGAMVRAAVRESRLPASRVTAVVSRRQGTVNIVPTSGSLVNAAAITRAVETAVAALDPQPQIRATVNVSERGVVGS